MNYIPNKAFYSQNGLWAMVKWGSRTVFRTLCPVQSGTVQRCFQSLFWALVGWNFHTAILWWKWWSIALLFLTLASVFNKFISNFYVRTKILACLHIDIISFLQLRKDNSGLVRMYAPPPFLGADCIFYWC